MREGRIEEKEHREEGRKVGKKWELSDTSPGNKEKEKEYRSTKVPAKSLFSVA